jgi:hypothetical protein
MMLSTVSAVPMCQAPGTSNRPQWGAYDRGSCTEEPCETERLTHGSESEVRTEKFLPTVTYRWAALQPSG